MICGVLCGCYFMLSYFLLCRWLDLLRVILFRCMFFLVVMFVVKVWENFISFVSVVLICWLLRLFGMGRDCDFIVSVFWGWVLYWMMWCCWRW